MANYYQLLGVASDAKPRDITRAYRVMALKYHPDRAGSDQSEATAMMAQINQAYTCLKDPQRRKRYDLSGQDDSENVLQGDVSGEGVLDAEDIEAFVSTYKGSKLEEEDVLSFLKSHKGDVSDMLDYIPLSESTDIDRLLQLCSKLMKEHRGLKKWATAFEKSAAQLKKSQPLKKKSEKREKKRFVKEHGDMSFADLVANIKNNQKRRRREAAAALL